ncbi:baseplate assembly protein [Agromyces luteolus]|uniref:Baseplate assembly protein n=1 Tax=Agromyces luteolus TaxID=88373 RepID=A0A7C9LWW1_9MICO|nr:baseplate assembly protein [Agromyces luteolus]
MVGAPYWGKYRGTCVDATDPQAMGRIRVSVPAVLGEVETPWAMPCLPAAAGAGGIAWIPSVGASVWVEFEGGDPARPIWVGGWFDPAGADGLRPGDIRITTSTGAAVTLSESGISIDTGRGAIITLSGPSVDVNRGGLTVT